MALSTKFIKMQLALFKPIVENTDIETERAAQRKIGELMAVMHKSKVTYEPYAFDNFKGEWIKPEMEKKNGVILYLHGGGYVSGDIEYAKGFGTVLATRHGINVFCIEYRLAPEYKFPAAVDDAFCAYKYLLDCGYDAEKIVICGESAGGGLSFSLCLKLKEEGYPQPSGIIAISPWTDLLSTGESYEANHKSDPSMSKDKLAYYSGMYTDDLKNPYVSPVYADLSKMPPSLIFAGGDEVMLSDAVDINKKLVSLGNKSELVIREKMWHAYVLYGIRESRADHERIEGFLNRVLNAEEARSWLRLDNAAKIYPAARRKDWSSLFRLSATLSDKVDPVVLQAALSSTIRRFPSIAVRLRRGAFWYYFEHIRDCEIRKDSCYPTVRMTKSEMRKCAFRVLYYENRIAVEYFHAITDGSGGMVFLKTLVSQYIKLKYGTCAEFKQGVLDVCERPHDSELEDSFLRYCGDTTVSRKEEDAYKITGTKELDGFVHVTTGIYDVNGIKAKAKEYKVSITEFLAAVTVAAIIEIEKKEQPNIRRQKPAKVLVPVDLRRVLKSSTLRNFAQYITPGIDPRMGDHSFDEIVKSIHHQFGLGITEKQMLAKITSNVKIEKLMVLKVMPLFIKNIAMKLAYNSVGEKKVCLNLSNLGVVEIPEELDEYIDRFDFVLGPQAMLVNNCGIVSYKGKMYINFTRNIEEPTLEREFFMYMKKLGLTAKIESNGR